MIRPSSDRLNKSSPVLEIILPKRPLIEENMFIVLTLEEKTLRDEHGFQCPLSIGPGPRRTLKYVRDVSIKICHS